MLGSAECVCGRWVSAEDAALSQNHCPRCGRPLARNLPRRAARSPVVLAAVAAGITAVVMLGVVAFVVARVNASSRTETVAAPPPAVLVAPPPRQAEQVLAEPPAPVPPPAEKAAAAPPVQGRLVASVEARREGRFAVGEELEQEVHFTRNSGYAVLGVPVAQTAKYSLTSRLTVLGVRPDGGLMVRQVIETARLIEADADMRETLAEALKKSVGAAFEITLLADGTVAGFTGPKDALRVREAKGPDGGPSVRLWSLLDADAWKDLAGTTFFLPGPSAKTGDTWSRPVAHDWGAFGSWAGQTTYLAKGRAAKPERIEFRHDLSHRPPQAGADANLPVRVVRPTFRVVVAGGAMTYDAAARRVTAADELFRVRGSATVAFAGQLAAVEVEESQEFKLRIGKPAAQPR